ncbi:MAG: GNAT family N-acetyltransferase [Bacteroidales bacterium]|nr:GNAT family N-acetyltransferase [Bacteroidales bacterium]MDT8372721.1 GNAT family N-acetyltransferase [Bacteroidales bacterium]
MNITVRPATEDDFPAVVSLIKELAEFERAPEKVTNSVEQMKQEQDLFRCFVAETETGEIVGMALFFMAYYTWVGKSIYLDDIYVKRSLRQQKIGTALLNKVFEVARAEKCRRVRWQVLDWNEPAISFYRKCGAEISGEWLNCSFDEAGIADFNI